jgi:hypothetical protein
MPDDHASDSGLDRRLRSALEAVATPADGTGVTASVARRVARHRRRVRSAAVAIVVAAVVGGIAAASLSSTGGVRRPDRVSASAPDATPPSHSRVAAGSNGPSVRSQFPRMGPAPVPAPCPAGASVPSMATGNYCGPRPPAGNGLGPNGECTGQETAPPCGRGVVPGRDYAYTMPGSCSGLVIFDGRRWVSELPPPTPVPAFDVWMRLTGSGSLGWIGPRGAVGFRPYTGQPLLACSGSTIRPPG